MDGNTPQDKALSDPVSTPIPSPQRVLLVDDNAASASGLSRVLTALGYNVTVAGDGVSALALLATPPPPDILLTDLRLPDLDGRELAGAARKLVPPPRVFLITGWDIDPASDEYLSWGIEDVLIKPIDLQFLLSLMRRTDPKEGRSS